MNSQQNVHVAERLARQFCDYYNRCANYREAETTLNSIAFNMRQSTYPRYRGDIEEFYENAIAWVINLGLL